MDIAAFAKKAQDKAEQAVKKVVIDLSNRIVLKTPVDSGRLRANWQLTIGQPASGQVDAQDKFGFLTMGKNAGEALYLRLGQTVFITNNLPYAQTVEYGRFGNPPGSANGAKTSGGYSSQTPQGMVRVSIRELQAQIK